MARARKSGGIVLVTTLLMMVLVVMMVTVVVYSGLGGLSLSGNFHEREMALLAADSGVQYAMARLQKNGNWRGNGTDLDSMAARADFSVIEKDGNVLGFLTTPNGHASQFRIKFNYEDGEGGEDGLADSGSPLQSPLVSVNNLMGSVARPVLRANADGRGVSSRAADYSVPRKTACLLVEGLAGWGLREASRTNPYRRVEGRGVTSRLVEVYLALNASDMVDAAAYSGGAINASLPAGGTFAVSSWDDDVVPRLRTLGDVTVNPSSGDAVRFDDGASGEVCVGTDQSLRFTLNHRPATQERVLNSTTVENFKSLNKLTWNSIAKAGPSDTRLPGGTYVWRTDSAGPYLEYFDRDLGRTEALPAAGTGHRVDTGNITASGGGVEVDGSSMMVLVSQNVLVQPTRNASGLAIRTDPEITASARRPSVAFVPAEASVKAPILTSPGSVRFEGAVLGAGAVTSEGEIAFQGPSILESDPETGVSLYAKGDISVEAIPQTVAQVQGVAASFVQSELAAGRDLPAAQQIQTFLSSGPGQQILQGITNTLAASGGVSSSSSRSGPPDWARAYGRRGSHGSHGGSGSSSSDSVSWTASPTSVTSDYMERKKAQLQEVLDKFGRLDYADQSLTGVIYTCRNFNANLGGEGVLHVTGSLVAYGGSPDGTNTPTAGTTDGNIRIAAAGVNLVYDSSYVQDLLSNVGAVRVKRTLWATY